MRVRFEYLRGKEEYELRKWTLSEAKVSEGKAIVLMGLKKCHAVKEVELMLKHEGKNNDPDAVESFFEQGGLGSVLSAKVVSRLSKVSDRFAQARGASLAVTLLDGLFGSDHCLANHSNLDLLCQKTGVRKDPALQAALLLC